MNRANGIRKLVKEVNEQKDMLEKNIRASICKFVNVTGFEVSDINIDHNFDNADAWIEEKIDIEVDIDWHIFPKEFNDKEKT